MLVLRRKTMEAIVLNQVIVIRVLAVEGDRVKLGIDAPPDVIVVREELTEGYVAPMATRTYQPRVELVESRLNAELATREAAILAQMQPCPTCGVLVDKRYLDKHVSAQHMREVS